MQALAGGQWAQRTVGTVLIVVMSPGLDPLVCIGDGSELQRIKTLVPQLAVGRLYVSVFRWISRCGEREPRRTALLGDATKAKQKLGWSPRITVQEMCAEMIREDLQAARRHALLKAHGHDLPVPQEG